MANKMKTLNGNTAAAHVAYAMSDVAAIYPTKGGEAFWRKAAKWLSNQKREVKLGQNV